MLCFLETPFLRFAYLPYYRRVQVCFESMLDLGFERKDCGKFIKVLEIDLLESRTLSIWRRYAKKMLNELEKLDLLASNLIPL